jgi:CheY-like chemotaxis protein
VDEKLREANPQARLGTHVRITVTDSGHGIPPEILDKIFDPFFTTKAPGKGTGLGLSTVLGIVASHGGFLNVRSAPGGGTTFEVFLPASIQTEVAEPSLQPQSLIRGKGELILIVDDETTILESTAALLRRNGYNVVTAADGVEGIAVFAEQRGKINLVLTDLLMPLMDGVAMIRGLRKMDPKLKIIAASGVASNNSLETKRSELMELGVVNLLSKPYSAEKLLASVADMLATA